MKFHGKKITGPNVEYAVIPRSSGNIIFKCEAVLDYKDFESMVPEPKPGIRMIPGGKTELNPDDKRYQDQVKDYNTKRFDYMIVKSLSSTDGLEWETVQYTNPDSWKNYESELKESGFSQNEINYVINIIMTANSLNQEKLEAARKDFLASLQAKEEN